MNDESPDGEEPLLDAEVGKGKPWAVKALRHGIGSVLVVPLLILVILRNSDVQHSMSVHVKDAIANVVRQRPRRGQPSPDPVARTVLFNK